VDWAKQLARKVPAQLLVVVGEKFLSGGGQEWVNLLKIMRVFMGEYFQDKLFLNSIMDQSWKVEPPIRLLRLSRVNVQ